MEREEKMQFAVLIDAENVSARYVQVIFDELEKYGFASCRRIYGNWFVLDSIPKNRQIHLLHFQKICKIFCQITTVCPMRSRNGYKAIHSSCATGDVLYCA